MVHLLNADSAVRPNKAIKDEVDKLLVADFFKTCDYLEWLYNVFMVKKANCYVV